jgi:hypothetical protein
MLAGRERSAAAADDEAADRAYISESLISCLRFVRAATHRKFLPAREEELPSCTSHCSNVIQHHDSYADVIH